MKAQQLKTRVYVLWIRDEREGAQQEKKRQDKKYF